MPITNGDVKRCEGGEVWHPICFDIAEANLASELESFMLANPDQYRRLPNGKFVEVEV